MKMEDKFKKLDELISSVIASQDASIRWTSVENVMRCNRIHAMCTIGDLAHGLIGDHCGKYIRRADVGSLFRNILYTAHSSGVSLSDELDGDDGLGLRRMVCEGIDHTVYKYDVPEALSNVSMCMATLGVNNSSHCRYYIVQALISLIVLSAKLSFPPLIDCVYVGRDEQ
jgi:hypothetical protein